MSIGTCLEKTGTLLVRSGGAALFMFGLWLTFMVLWEAWGVYREPERIEAFAAVVEQGTHIDATLRSLLKSRPASPARDAAADPLQPGTDDELLRPGADGDPADPGPPPIEQPQAPVPSISYLVSCIILILLLLLLARISLATVQTGACLVLQRPGGNAKP